MTMRGLYATARSAGLAALLITGVFVPIAQAQTDQQISGNVVDATGGAMPGVTVVAVRSGTGASRETISNNTGNYVIANLAIGAYTVTATMSGFKTFIAENVQLTIGSNLNVNVVLEVGDLTETVAVTGATVQPEVTTAEIGHLITGKEATQIQLNGRNFVQLVSLLPGVSTTSTSSFRLQGPFGTIGAAQSVNGTRPDTASFLVNNVDNKDPGGESSSSFVNVSPDAIEEFKTVAGSQSAQFGLNAGPTITMALKSGASAFHGTAYEYFRHDALQELSFQATTKPPLRYDNFGGTIGGPLVLPGFNASRNKAFFFFSQDTKRRRVTDIATWAVPNMAQRAGDFSALPAPQWPIDTATGQPFPGGVIPQQRINAMGQALVNLYPEPNATVPGGNFIFPNPNDGNIYQYLIKGDYVLSDRNRISLHYIKDLPDSKRGTTNAIMFDSLNPGFNSGLQWTSVISSSTVNTLVVGFAGKQNKQQTGIRPNATLGFDTTSAAAYGLTYPRIFGVNGEIPSLQMAGFTTLSVTPFNFNNDTRNLMVRDDVSRVAGNHMVKVGAVALLGRKSQDSWPAINGQFQFAPAGRPGSTGNAVADALLGLYNTYTEAPGNTQALTRQWNVEAYVQDDWRVSPALTLNFGVRWSWIQPTYLVLNNGSAFLPEYFDPSRAPQIAPGNGAIIGEPGTYDPYNGLVIGGDGFPERARGIVPGAIMDDPAVQALFRGVPKGYVDGGSGNWSPRVGLAYDLSGRQATVLRAGFAVTNERLRTTILNATTNQPPFGGTVQVRNGDVSNPSGGTRVLFPASIGRTLDPDLKVPTVTNWQVGVQQALGPNRLLDIAYVGSRGDNLTWSKNINQLEEGTLQRNPGVNANALRPYPGYADIGYVTNGGIWRYHSLQSQFQWRVSSGAFFRASYTWSRNLTDSHDPFYTPMDSSDLHRDYGPAYFNKPHVLTVSYSYPLPFLRDRSGWSGGVLGGWTVSGVTMYSSGWPINVVVASDIAGVGSNPTSGVSIDGAARGGFVQRANLIGDPYANTTSTQVLNPAAFAVPVPGTYGNAGAFAFRGPRIVNWDLTLDKTIRATSSVNLNFRIECFNIFNRFSYVNVQNVVNQANFGQVNGATDPRTFQLAARLTF